MQETKSYTVVGAIDPESKTRLDINAALQRRIIDEANGLYVGKDATGNTFKIPISEAIRRGLVFTAETSDATVQEGSRFINTTKTFSVQGVIDPATGDEMSVTEAIQRGKENSAVARKCFWWEKIQRSFLSPFLSFFFIYFIFVLICNKHLQQTRKNNNIGKQ